MDDSLYLTRKGFSKLDETASGVFAIPPDSSVPVYNVRKLDAYCKEHGKQPLELTQKELGQFEVKNQRLLHA